MKGGRRITANGASRTGVLFTCRHGGEATGRRHKERGVDEYPWCQSRMARGHRHSAKFAHGGVLAAFEPQ
jgi:hypothetical protein